MIQLFAEASGLTSIKTVTSNALSIELSVPAREIRGPLIIENDEARIAGDMAVRMVPFEVRLSHSCATLRLARASIAANLPVRRASITAKLATTAACD